MVFVKHGLPQQKVLARIVKRKSGHAEAVPVEILQQSLQAVRAKCDHFPTCGGCAFQNLDYAAQLEEKRKQTLDLFRRMGGIHSVKLDRVVAAENPFHYRNKMEFSFSNRRWILPDEDQGVDATFALGLHVAGRYEKVLNIDTCWIQKPIANEILKSVRETVLENGLEPYDILKHTGFVRNLVIRVGENTGEVMVNLVTSREEPDLLRPVVERLTTDFPQVVSIVNNITRRKAAVAYGEWEVLLFGQPTIREELGGYTFEISPNSFFQTNTAQAEKLYKVALEFADFSGDEILYDLYSGSGSTSCCAASHVGQVYGFDVIPSAVQDAVRNAISNGLFNCRFFEANLDRYFRTTSILKEIEKPDAVLVDPPRAGMHPKLVKDVIRMAPRKIIYISCNPSTQARDVAVFTEGKYKVRSLAMVDMFPHTPHIETVALLERTGSV